MYHAKERQADYAVLVFPDCVNSNRLKPKGSRIPSTRGVRCLSSCHGPEVVGASFQRSGHCSCKRFRICSLHCSNCKPCNARSGSDQQNKPEELDEMLSASMNRALSRAGVGGCRTVNKPCWVDAQCCTARCQPSIRRCRPVR